MAVLLEDHIPVVKHQGLNTNKNITIGGSANFDMSGSTGTFALPTGAFTFNGTINVASGKDIIAAGGASDYDFSLSSGFTKTGTGAVTINGATTFAADKGIAYTSGTGAADFSNGSGVFKTTTGAVTINGATTFAVDKGIVMTAGTGAMDFSLGTGVFKTTTGAATYGASSNTFTNAITPSGGVAAAGGFTATPRNIHTGGQPPLVSTDGTNTTIVTTETYIAEVFIPCNMTVTGVAVFNGAAVAGNLQASLADSTGAVISAAQTASTAQSGTDAYQRIPFAVAYAAKGPATYYVMVQGNNTGGNINTHTFGNFNAQKQTSQTYGTFTTITVAGTFTTAVGPMVSLY